MSVPLDPPFVPLELPAEQPDPVGLPSDRAPAGSAAPPATVDPGHWLYRLTAQQWLSAAENELRGAQSALSGKQQRAGVTYARRAAGMALNARLCLDPEPDPAYGRSYMEHLQALQHDAAVSPEVCDAARRLLAVPITPQLVTLGPKGDTKPADFAARIVAYVQQVVSRRGPANPDDSAAG